MAEYIESLQRLSEQFGRLPGVGRKSAMRMAYAVLEMPDDDAKAFADAIISAKEKIHLCPICKNLTDKEVCGTCSDLSRDTGIICVVEDPKDVISFEKVREFNGVYHVLHGVIDPLSGIGPNDIRIRELLARIQSGDVKEVIIATNPDVSGDATAMYIAKLIKPLDITVTRLSRGIPVGSEIEYTDDVTLARAFVERNKI